MENHFAKIMTSKSDVELLEHVKNKGHFQEVAVIAAIKEIEKRNGINPEIQLVKEQIVEKLEFERQIYTQQQLKVRVPEDLPSSVRKAAQILYAALGVDVLNAIITQFTTGFHIYPLFLGVILALFIIGSILFIIYMINLGKRWARNIFLFFFVLGIFKMPEMVDSLFRQSILSALLFLLSSIMQLLALILLFMPKAVEWYQKKQSN